MKDYGKKAVYNGQPTVKETVEKIQHPRFLYYDTKTHSYPQITKHTVVQYHLQQPRR